MTSRRSRRKEEEKVEKGSVLAMLLAMEVLLPMSTISEIHAVILLVMEGGA
jgi:hypothetical protein